MVYRCAGFECLIGLMLMRKIKRDYLITYFKTLYQLPLCKNEHFLTLLILCSCNIHPGELMPDIKHALKQCKNGFLMSFDLVQELFELGKSRCIKERLYSGTEFMPITNVAESMLSGDFFLTMPHQIDDPIIADLFEKFDNAESEFPYALVEQALSLKERITPYVLEIIKDAAQNYATHDLTSRNLMLALYLAAKFREKKAFNSIVQIASLPGDWPDEFFPGAVGDSLSGFLLSTYDGNLDALKGLVENEAIHDSSRELALEAIVGLVSLGRIRRDEIISYFRTLFTSPLCYDPLFTANLVWYSSELYPDELLPEIQKVYRENKVDTILAPYDDVEYMLELDKQEYLGTDLDLLGQDLLIDDIAAIMSTFPIFESNHNDSCSCDYEDDETIHVAQA